MPFYLDCFSNEAELKNDKECATPGSNETCGECGMFLCLTMINVHVYSKCVELKELM